MFSCLEQTDYAVLISDSWYAVTFDEWKPNLEEIKKKAKPAIYLMVGGRASPINIDGLKDDFPMKKINVW